MGLVSLGGLDFVSALGNSIFSIYLVSGFGSTTSFLTSFYLCAFSSFLCFCSSFNCFSDSFYFKRSDFRFSSAYFLSCCKWSSNSSINPDFELPSYYLIILSTFAVSPIIDSHNQLLISLGIDLDNASR